VVGGRERLDVVGAEPRAEFGEERDDVRVGEALDGSGVGGRGRRWDGDPVRGPCVSSAARGGIRTRLVSIHGVCSHGRPRA
jgi:hypothetical protein